MEDLEVPVCARARMPALGRGAMGREAGQRGKLFRILGFFLGGQKAIRVLSTAM